MSTSPALTASPSFTRTSLTRPPISGAMAICSASTVPEYSRVVAEALEERAHVNHAAAKMRMSTTVATTIMRFIITLPSELALQPFQDRTTSLGH
jgi:hypothetical protein